MKEPLLKLRKANLSYEAKDRLNFFSSLINDLKFLKATEMKMNGGSATALRRLKSCPMLKVVWP